MKQLALTVALLVLMGSQLVYADEHPGILSRTWSGLGGVVTTVVVVSHEVLHVVEQVGGASMKVVHSTLDVLSVPWAPHTA